ncbi:hypothetical protein ACWD6P_21555 [Streptomyces sp. NPDC002446]
MSTLPDPVEPYAAEDEHEPHARSGPPGRRRAKAPLDAPRGAVTAC